MEESVFVVCTSSKSLFWGDPQGDRCDLEVADACSVLILHPGNHKSLQCPGLIPLIQTA